MWQQQNMSSSDGLRARLNGRRQPQEQNEKIDRRDFNRIKVFLWLPDWNNNNNPSILVVRISRKTWVVKEETKGCCRILGIFYLARFRLMLLVARSKGFKMMIEAVGDYNQQLNPPTQEMNKPHDDQIKQT
ncbi:hypothetical protein JHK87_048122 [Glycine soja]|nr:hypothetical protein JHK87_048122 [Glycine soja]